MTDEETQKEQNHPLNEIHTKLKESYAIAAGMFWQDRGFLIPFYLLLIIPDFLVASSLDSTTHLELLEVLKRGLHLLFVYIVCFRWAKLLSARPLTFQMSSLGLMLLFGFAFWLIFIIPGALLVLAPAELQIVWIIALVPALILALKYYFYFFPIVFEVKSLKKILSHAQGFTLYDKFLAVRTLVAPMGLMLFCISLIKAISPDGREAFVNYFASVFTGVFSVFSTYLSFAFCLVLLSVKAWHELNLDPYREARLSTLAFQGPPWLAMLLKPKHGLIMLAMGTLIWAGNEMRASQMLPAPQISIQALEIQDKQLRLYLGVADEEHAFRGFYPIFFRLAGEKGSPISEYPETVIINGELREKMHGIPSNLNYADLVLEFKSDRSQEELKSLEDLFLWYRQARIEWLDPSKAKLIK